MTEKIDCIAPLFDPDALWFEDEISKNTRQEGMMETECTEMQANAEHAFSPREQRIIDLASAINDVMRTHADRDEAIDAYDIARVLFRRTVNH